MKILGLTGGIATGKSTVLRMFARLGATTYDADAAVHTLLASDTTTIAAVRSAFPELSGKGGVNRKQLGSIVFQDTEKLDVLESILHPRIRVMETKMRRRYRIMGVHCMVCDIPLLFETEAEARFDAVVTTAVSPSLQRSRTMARPGMTPERYEQIIAEQMPTHEKIRRADYIVHTGLGLAYSMEQVKRIMQEVLGDTRNRT